LVVGSTAYNILQDSDRHHTDFVFVPDITPPNGKNVKYHGYRRPRQLPGTPLFGRPVRWVAQTDILGCSEPHGHQRARRIACAADRSTLKVGEGAGIRSLAGQMSADYTATVPTINLPEDELAAVTAAIRRAIEDDKFPHAPRLDPLRAALARLDAASNPTPDPKAAPPAKADKRARR
jgi:hypothetical protein